MTLAEIKAEDGSDAYRAFVTHTSIPTASPAKDRSGRLDLLEPPDLCALIRSAQAHPVPTNRRHSQSRISGVITMTTQNWNDFQRCRTATGFDLIPKGHHSSRCA